MKINLVAAILCYVLAGFAMRGYIETGLAINIFSALCIFAMASINLHTYLEDRKP